MFQQTLFALGALQRYSRCGFGAWGREVSDQGHFLMQSVDEVERRVNDRQEPTLNQPDRVKGRCNLSPYPAWR
ncbi:hypothetical protein [uncultured Thiodictyon sp.]|uniref:hypothetical protein n=1 Tax=uncultured Thiodictyon sp. TaxID=1846217 RepID=UPI0025CF69B5|nr:hypothetical protein [uncultured Thiodictyon sp.]